MHRYRHQCMGWVLGVAWMGAAVAAPLKTTPEVDPYPVPPGLNYRMGALDGVAHVQDVQVFIETCIHHYIVSHPNLQSGSRRASRSIVARKGAGQTPPPQ